MGSGSYGTGGKRKTDGGAAYTDSVWVGEGPGRAVDRREEISVGLFDTLTSLWKSAGLRATFEISDTIRSGLRLRVQPRGPTFFARVQYQGKESRVRIGRIDAWASRTPGLQEKGGVPVALVGYILDHADEAETVRQSNGMTRRYTKAELLGFKRPVMEAWERFLEPAAAAVFLLREEKAELVRRQAEQPGVDLEEDRARLRAVSAEAYAETGRDERWRRAERAVLGGGHADHGGRPGGTEIVRLHGPRCARPPVPFSRGRHRRGGIDRAARHVYSVEPTGALSSWHRGAQS